MPDFYFGIGLTAAGIVNIETITTIPPHVLDNQRVPLLGPIRRQTLDRQVQRAGSINRVLQWDMLTLAELNTLITTYWTAYTTSSVSAFVSWPDETYRSGVNNYTLFSCVLERPIEGEHYEIVNSIWARNVRIPAYGLTRQITTRNTTGSIGTGERYTQSNTTSAAVTLTLPAATVNANTVFTVEKTGGSNTLTVQRAGSDTINGGTSVTVSSRTNFVSNGATAWTTI